MEKLIIELKKNIFASVERIRIEYTARLYIIIYGKKKDNSPEIYRVIILYKFLRIFKNPPNKLNIKRIR